MKRGELLVVFLMLSLLIVPVISANIFSDFWKDFRARITGQAQSSSTDLNITIGNTAPIIIAVFNSTGSGPNSTGSPTEGTSTTITLNFTALDIDGVANLDNSTAQAAFSKSGQATRSNTSCITALGASNSTAMNYTCTIKMWYFDANANDWIVNVTIEDINNAMAENSTTRFTLSLLTAMVMSPTNLTWSAIGATAVNTGSNNDPIILNNTGNDIDLTINVTGRDLRGEVDISKYIYANNFSVSNATEGCPTTFSTNMTNATSLNITATILQRGNNSLSFNNATSGQEETFYCLKGVLPITSAQSYSSSAFGSWIVQII